MKFWLIIKNKLQMLKFNNEKLQLKIQIVLLLLKKTMQSSQNSLQNKKNFI